MRIKIKDLELALEHMKKNLCESTEVEFASDEKGIHVMEMCFTDEQKKIAKIVLFDANVNVTPDLVAKTKLYKT